MSLTKWSDSGLSSSSSISSLSDSSSSSNRSTNSTSTDEEDEVSSNSTLSLSSSSKDIMLLDRAGGEANVEWTDNDDDDDDDDDVVARQASLRKGPKRRLSSSTDSLECGSVLELAESDSCLELESSRVSESDSGLESDDGGVGGREEQTQEECARQLRRWLCLQASREREVGEDDIYYLENRERLWPTSEERGGAIQDLANCNYDPYPVLQRESYRYSGERDRLGRPCGKGTAHFPNGRKFLGTFKMGSRQGPGELFEREGGRIASGNYRHDRSEINLLNYQSSYYSKMTLGCKAAAKSPRMRAACWR